jgi:hypothetical protein
MFHLDPLQCRISTRKSRMYIQSVSMTGTYISTRYVVMSYSSPLHRFVSRTVWNTWVRTDQTVQFVTTKEPAIPVFVTPCAPTGYADIQGLSHVLELILHIITLTINTVYVSHGSEYFRVLFNITNTRNKQYRDISTKCLSECDAV